MRISPNRSGLRLHLANALLSSGDESGALAELLLDITKWSTQKIHVALGTDGADALPRDAAGVSYLTFDDAGRAVTSGSITP